MEIDEILRDSESELEESFDDLDLYSMDDEEDEENNNLAPSTQKRYASRKWRSSGFDPKILKFSDRASEVSEEFETGGNKPSDYFQAFFDNELMQKIVKETNNYQQQNAASNVGKTALVQYDCERIVHLFRHYNFDGIESKESHERLLVNG
ncbi:unnamed protein product [Didymodactylos carnosus]|uniref:PiggyBac transposable element-derived protein domain-containing protein n=1 Tax=Didymodactylos carnosus TaxID=1234261 RepID=A0A8S2CMR2_9BILA|nr:unnamed protein product [Didymodactylos carnosus]CAF3530849.1 unnamed protein product [Didymodactylos carnosus]